MKNKLIVIILFFCGIANVYAATRAGTTISNTAYINSDISNVTSNEVTFSVHAIYGYTVSEYTVTSHVVPNATSYIVHTVYNFSNTTNNITINITATNSEWTADGIFDDNQDGIHQLSETTAFISSYVHGIAPSASYTFFIRLQSPSQGKQTSVIIHTNSQYHDGNTYTGINGFYYGGKDLVTITDNYLAFDNLPPEISDIRIDDKNVLPGDYISERPVITATIIDLDPGINISSLKVLVDGVPQSGVTINGTTLTCALTISLSLGTHEFTFIAADTAGNTANVIVGGLIVSSEATIVGQVLNYPNPFSPDNGGTQIGYRLTKACDITITLYNLIGQPIWRQRIAAGLEGAREGYNRIWWYGDNGFGSKVGNGVYIGIVATDKQKVLGKVKILVAR